MLGKRWLGRKELCKRFELASHRVARVFDDVGTRPWGIGISADGRTIYTANGPSGDVSFIDAATGQVTRKVAVGGSPWGLVVK